QGDFSRAAIGNRVVSRIHVHDLARLCVAVADLARAEPHNAPRLVHAVDGHSVGQREVFNWLEARYDLKIPGDWRSQPYVGRHIRSRFLDQLLPTGLQYPDYRSGFADCLE
ncbi:MAG: hypothetical protein KDK30_16450, partial [Leptospiraceae bacterium]|nr:hypothetical protein [Leptospiraceae bacterium]